MSIALHRLGPEDGALMRDLNALFATAFEDPASYASTPPSEAYLRRILAQPNVIALVALAGEGVVGGLVAYVLDKLEQERAEIYIYDLAVAARRRREGIATALIDELRRLASDMGAWVIYVQADYGDEPAITLYEKIGAREDVMHFDISPAAIR